MKLDRESLSSLISDMPSASEGQTRGFAVSAVTPDLLDAWSRLLSLLDTPQDVPVLAPMREREVLYRLLKGPQGGVLRQIARVEPPQPGSSGDRVDTVALQRDVARRATRRAGRHEPGIIPPPLQGCDRDEPASISEDAAPPGGETTARRSCRRRRRSLTVGYGSASQFSREYARMSGAPPARDAERLRGTPTVMEGVDNAAAINLLSRPA
jgi:hypothetical protein